MASIHKKILIVGDHSCGKTTLLNVFKEGISQNVVKTLKSFNREITIDDKQVQLEVWDTPELEKFDGQRQCFYLGLDAIIMCFSIDSRDSFNNIKRKWVKEVTTYCRQHPIVLVGNKEDLRIVNDSVELLTEDEQTQVTLHQGQVLADEISAVGYKECSALNGEDVQKVLEVVTRAALDADKNKKKGCVIL